MAFFDQKQEVLNLTMTTYGRYLYSRGRFMPEYYAFFDDDIIYDSSYCHSHEQDTETQNEIEDRVLYTSPRLKPLTTFSGVETNLKKQMKIAKSSFNNQRPGHELITGTAKDKVGMNFQHELERDYALGMPLGRTTPDNDDPPLFRVVMLAGSIADSAPILTDPNIGGALRIPQVDIDVEYEITAHNNLRESKTNLEQVARANNRHATFSPNFADGSFLKIEGSHALIMIEEDNVEYGIDQFDVEVFEEVIEVKRVNKKDANGIAYVLKQQTTSFVPLFFDQIESMLDSSQQDLSHGFGSSESPGHVGDYFDLNLDGEVSIPTSVLESSVVDRVTINNALQKNSSMFLSKPLLSSSFSELQDFGLGTGLLSDFETDIYYTGIDLGDPTECD